MGRVLLALWLIGGCAEPPVEAPPPAEVAPPVPPPMPLAEALYGGELGAEAAPLGDRVRVLLWLRAMDLDGGELEALREAALRVSAEGDRARAALAAAGEEEARALAPIYAELAAALAAGVPDDAAAASAAERIAAVRAGLEGTDRDPRRVRARAAAAALAEAEAWAATLDEAQRVGMAQALFFLRRQVSAETTPALMEDLLGAPWQPGDFASLRRSRSGEQGQLDIGGLFTLEGGARDLTQDLDGLKLHVLVAVALSHPDLVPAIEVLQGLRDPLDLGTGAP